MPTQRAITKYCFESMRNDFKANFPFLLPENPCESDCIELHDFNGDAHEDFWLRNSGNPDRCVSATIQSASILLFPYMEMGCYSKVELGIDGVRMNDSIIVYLLKLGNLKFTLANISLGKSNLGSHKTVNPEAIYIYRESNLCTPSLAPTRKCWPMSMAA